MSNKKFNKHRSSLKLNMFSLSPSLCVNSSKLDVTLSLSLTVKISQRESTDKGIFVWRRTITIMERESSGRSNNNKTYITTNNNKNYELTLNEFIHTIRPYTIGLVNYPLMLLLLLLLLLLLMVGIILWHGE